MVSTDIYWVSLDQEDEVGHGSLGPFMGRRSRRNGFLLGRIGLEVKKVRFRHGERIVGDYP